MFSNLEDDNKDDDFLDEFRQKLGNQSLENFEEKKNEINRSKNVFIGAVSGIALAAVVGWFVLSPRYANLEDTDLPVIRRPQSAVKVQPAEPGGMEILNQDKSVYNIIEKKADNTPAVENLLPPPEEPQLPVIASQPQPVSQPDMNVVNQVIAEQKPSAVEQKAEEIIRVAEAPKPQTVKETAPEKPAVTISEAMTQAPLEQPQTQDELPKAETAKVVPSAPPPANKIEKAAAAGSWQVQLMSSPNKKAMDSAWSNLVKKYPFLARHLHEIETADLGAKGTFYRLKAGAFADRSGADNLCNDIKALGGTCIVKKK